MRRKIAFVADTHADGARKLDEHDRVMRWISWDAAQRGACAMIHTGDVYERSSSSKERESVIEWAMLTTEKMPLLIVGGNHDDPKDIWALGYLRTKHRIDTVVSPGPLIPLVPFSAAEPMAWVAALPWPRRGFFLASAPEMTSREEVERHAGAALRNILRDYGERFRELDPRRPVPRIFAGHVMIRGSRVGTSQPPLVGADMELGVEDLATVGADFYGLGHIHLGQEFPWASAGVLASDAETPMVYPGSPYARNFGEKEPKSYVLATFEDGRCVGYERIPTPATELVDVDADDLDLVDPQDIPRGSEVRLRIETRPEDRVAALARADEAEKALLAAGAASVKLEVVTLVETRARAPEVAQASTNRARLEAYWGTSGKSPTLGRREAILDKLAQIESESAGTPTTEVPNAVPIDSSPRARAVP